MHLIYRPRPSPAVGLAAACHPVLVSPLVSEVPDDRSLPWRAFGVDGERVCLVRAGAGNSGVDVVLVQRTVLDAGDEALPDPGLLAGIEPVGSLIPAVEVADHADP